MKLIPRAGLLLALVLIALFLALQTPQPATRPAPVTLPATVVEIPAIIESSLPESGDAFENFALWAAEYARASAQQRALSEPFGASLATRRKTAMKALIRSNPQVAFERSLSAELRRELPAHILALIEQPASGPGRLRLQGASPVPGSTRKIEALRRKVELNGELYAAYTFGEPLKFMPGAVNVRALILDDLLALHDSSERILDQPNLTQVSTAAVRSTAATRGTQFSAVTILYIIAKFSDEAAQPVDIPTVTAHMNTTNTFFQDNSYGKNSITSTFVEVALPNPKSFYKALTTKHFEKIITDGTDVAKARAGQDHKNFDLFIVATSFIGGDFFTYGGVANVGTPPSTFDPGMHLNGFYALETVGHELGHNYGLLHDNYWLTDSVSPIGRDSMPGGVVGDGVNAELIEYGHRFSLMSAQFTPDFLSGQAHFTARDKVHIGWIAPAEAAIVSTTTKVRVFRHDHRSATASPRSVKIAAKTSDYTPNDRRYWLEYRMAYNNTNNNESLKNGLAIDWCTEVYGNDGSVQIDTTPNSKNGPFIAGDPPYLNDLNDKTDAPLTIGRTYSDAAAGIHITTLSKGGTAPNEYLDAQINLGTFAANKPPVISALTVDVLTSPAKFSVTATDPDGDPLVYSWEYGDGNFSDISAATQVYQYATGSIYTVKCTVSDMKGGQAVMTQSVTLRVVPPAAPDLIIDSIALASGTLTAGTNVTFAVTVRNQGSAAITTPFNVGFYSNMAAPPVIATPAPQNADLQPLLAPGHSMIIEFPVSNITLGTFTAWAFADRNGGAAGAVVEISETNNAGPGSGFVWKVREPLKITSGPSATPAIVPVGTAVNFNVTAVSADTYTWDFGDGSPKQSGPAVPATHTYAAAGVYNVTLVVSNAGNESVTGMVTVSAYLDLDGDGVPDLSPTGDNSTYGDIVAQVTGKPAVPLAVKTLAIGLNFSKTASDSITFAGTLPLPANFTPAGQKVQVVIGGLGLTMPLTDKGKYADANVKFSVGISKKLLALPASKFSLTIKKSDIQGFFTDEKFTNRTAVKESLTVRATIFIAGTLSDLNCPQQYSSKETKTGKTKKF